MEVDKKSSRRYFIIKILMIMLAVNSIYMLVAIAYKPGNLEPFSAYFLTTNGALVATIGTWIGFVSAKKKSE